MTADVHGEAGHGRDIDAGADGLSWSVAQIDHIGRTDRTAGDRTAIRDILVITCGATPLTICRNLVTA